MENKIKIFIREKREEEEHTIMKGNRSKFLIHINFHYDLFSDCSYNCDFQVSGHAESDSRSAF